MAERPTYEELEAKLAEYESLFRAIRRHQADAVVGEEQVAMLRPQELELALRASEERFRLLADNMAQLAWIADAEGRAVWFNGRFEKFTGLQDMAKLPPEERAVIFHSDHRERVNGHYINCIAKGIPYEDVLPLRRTDGTYRWFLSRAVPVRNAEGRITSWFGTNTDITEERKAEDALRESERMLSLIYHHTSDVIYLVRVDPGEQYTVISVNDTFLHVTGYTREQVIDKPMEEVVAQENTGLVRGKYHEAITTRAPVTYMETAELPAGRRHTQITVVPIFEGKGPVTHLLASIVDLTERQAVQEARRLADERYRAIVNSSDDAIISKDLNGTITSWNKGAERIFGYTAKEIMGRSIRLLIPPELHAEEEAILERIQRAERVEHFETVRVHKNGNRLHISVTVSPLTDATGRVIGAGKVARDITAQKRAMDRIRESEAKFTTMFMEAPVGIVLTDAVHGDVLDANPAFVDLCGYGLPDLKGNSFLASGMHRDPEEREHIMERLRREGRLRDEEVRIFHRSGRPMHVLLNATPVIISGQSRVLIHVEDITARKVAEEGLMAADRRKDEFLATLAHELRSPLAPLANALQLLELSADDPATSSRARTMMSRQLDHMVHLVNDLMDLSRISRGVIGLRKTPVDVGAALGQAVEATRPMIDRHGHTLRVLPWKEPLWVMGDVTRLVQIFNNLLNNAAKYTDPGGTITASITGEGQEAIVTVTDTGIGIGPEEIAKVFDMFAQLEPTSTRSHNGLGIGLSIVRQLVGLHGGSIQAASPGRGSGSTFTVRLPLTTTPVQNGNSNTLSASNGSTLRVLVTDDNVESAVTLAMVLRKLGHDVHAVHNGNDALVEVGTFRPHVVFLDIGMPVMDGYETCRRIRATQHGVDAYIVALTGWGQDEDKRQAEAAGFDLHVVKPVGRDKLMEILTSYQEQVRAVKG